MVCTVCLDLFIRQLDHSGIPIFIKYPSSTSFLIESCQSLVSLLINLFAKQYVENVMQMK